MDPIRTTSSQTWCARTKSATENARQVPLHRTYSSSKPSRSSCLLPDDWLDPFCALGFASGVGDAGFAGGGAIFALDDCPDLTFFVLESTDDPSLMGPFSEKSIGGSLCVFAIASLSALVRSTSCRATLKSNASSRELKPNPSVALAPGPPRQTA